MTAPIAKMFREMIARGVDPEMIALAIETAETVARPVDVRADSKITAMDRRREWDRERKRLQRGLRLPEGEWFPLVAKILERDGGKCTYCGSHERLTADHVVPLTRGGTNEESNLTACCIPCNTKKSNKLVSEWLPGASTVFHPDVQQNPPDDDSALTILDNSSQKKPEKKERAKSSRGEKLPPDAKPSAEQYQLGIDSGFDRNWVDQQFEDMRIWARTNEHRAVARKSDWDLTFTGWLRRSAGQAKGRVNGNGTGAHGANQQSAAIIAGTAAAVERRARERSAGGQGRESPAGGGVAGRDDFEFFGSRDG